MPAKNYKLVKKPKINSEEVISKARNVKELLLLEFPLSADELKKINYILDAFNTTISQFESRIANLEKQLRK